MIMIKLKKTILRKDNEGRGVKRKQNWIPR